MYRAMFSFTAIEKEVMISIENLNQKEERTLTLLLQTYGLLQNIFLHQKLIQMYFLTCQLKVQNC